MLLPGDIILPFASAPGTSMGSARLLISSSNKDPNEIRSALRLPAQTQALWF